MRVRISITACRTFAALTLGLLLAGCLTSEQTAQRNEERCAEAGYQKNTDAFANCITDLETKRSLRMSQRHREMTERPWVPPSPTGSQ